MSPCAFLVYLVLGSMVFVSCCRLKIIAARNPSLFDRDDRFVLLLACMTVVPFAIWKFELHGMQVFIDAALLLSAAGVAGKLVALSAQPQRKRFLGRMRRRSALALRGLIIGALVIVLLHFHYFVPAAVPLMLYVKVLGLAAVWIGPLGLLLLATGVYWERYQKASGTFSLRYSILDLWAAIVGLTPTLFFLANIPNELATIIGIGFGQVLGMLLGRIHFSRTQPSSRERWSFIYVLLGAVLGLVGCTAELIQLYYSVQQKDFLPFIL